MAFKNAPKSWMNGVTVGAGDIDTGVVSNDHLAGSITSAKLAGSIANNKLANPYAVFPLIQHYVAAGTLGTHLNSLQTVGAITITEICFSASSNGTSGATTIDLHAGPNAASAVTVFGSGSKLTILKGSTLKVAAPSGALGSVADNGYVRLDIDADTSAVAGHVTITVWAKQPHVA